MPNHNQAGNPLPSPSEVMNRFGNEEAPQTPRQLANFFERTDAQGTMKTWKKAALLTAAIAVPAFLLGPVLFPKGPDFPTMTRIEFALFMPLAIWTPLLFGAAVSFLVFGWPAARRSPQPGKTTAALLAITWVTGSWWVHDNLHMHVGMNVPGLMAIEYGFHFTAGLAGLVLGYLFIDAVKNRFQFWTPDSSPYETDPDKLASRPSHQ
jgi:hypothetical protein